MKLYQSHYSPNSRRVRMYLAEKGLQVPCLEVDISQGASHTPEYLKLNPMGQVPLLQLDDGNTIAESVAICRYFEAQTPAPSLFGTNAEEIAIIEMWQRRVELNWFAPLIQYWHHTSPMWAGRVKQLPEWAEQNRAAIQKFTAWLDSELTERDYIAGSSFSIADILALATIDHSTRIAGLVAQPELKNLARWHERVSSRPSAQA